MTVPATSPEPARDEAASAVPFAERPQVEQDRIRWLQGEIAQVEAARVSEKVWRDPSLLVLPSGAWSCRRCPAGGSADTAEAHLGECPTWPMVADECADDCPATLAVCEDARAAYPFYMPCPTHDRVADTGEAAPPGFAWLACDPDLLRDFWNADGPTCPEMLRRPAQPGTDVDHEHCVNLRTGAGVIAGPAAASPGITVVAVAEPHLAAMRGRIGELEAALAARDGEARAMAGSSERFFGEIQRLKDEAAARVGEVRHLKRRIEMLRNALGSIDHPAEPVGSRTAKAAIDYDNLIEDRAS